MPSIAGIPPARQGQFYPLPSYYSVDAAALLAGIEEKAIRREITGRPGAPLVSRSISHRAPLPTWGPSPMGLFPARRIDCISEGLPKDVHVVRCHPDTPPEARVPTPRAAICEFSRKSAPACTTCAATVAMWSARSTCSPTTTRAPLMAEPSSATWTAGSRLPAASWGRISPISGRSNSRCPRGPPPSTFS